MWDGIRGEEMWRDEARLACTLTLSSGRAWVRALGRIPMARSLWMLRR